MLFSSIIPRKLYPYYHKKSGMVKHDDNFGVKLIGMNSTFPLKFPFKSPFVDKEKSI